MTPKINRLRLQYASVCAFNALYIMRSVQIMDFGDTWGGHTPEPNLQVLTVYTDKWWMNSKMRGEG